MPYNETGGPGSAAVAPVCVNPITMATVRATRETATRMRVSRAVRVTPRVFTTVNAATARMATGFTQGPGTA